MEFTLAITAAQAYSLGQWVAVGDDFAEVLLDQADGKLYVGQGDSRVIIVDDGRLEAA